MKTLVLGASSNPSRYSYLAIKMLLAHKQEVVAVGKTDGQVDGITIGHDMPAAGSIDTVTLYMSPEHQKLYYDKIVALKPRRIIFNPGTENSELKDLVEKNGIETEYACTLVMLQTGQY